MVDKHLKGLNDMFSKRRKITFSIEFVYKEVTGDSTTAQGKKKKKSATEAQKLQRAADAGLWSRLHRCRAKHCKQGPHCLPDDRGNHRKLLPAQLEEIVCHIKANMKEGETEEDVDVDIEIPPHILKNILVAASKCFEDTMLRLMTLRELIVNHGALEEKVTEEWEHSR